MFHGMGTQWALTLDAFVPVTLAPIPFVFYYDGPHIRRNSKFAPGHKPAAAPGPATTSTASVEDAAAEMDLAQVEERREEHEKERREVVLDGVAAAEAERMAERSAT